MSLGVCCVVLGPCMGRGPGICVWARESGPNVCTEASLEGLFSGSSMYMFALSVYYSLNSSKTCLIISEKCRSTKGSRALGFVRMFLDVTGRFRTRKTKD